MDGNENVVEETIVDNDETVVNIETEQQESHTEEQQGQAGPPEPEPEPAGQKCLTQC